MDEGLVGLGLFSGHAAEAREKARGDADSDQLLGVASNRASDAAGAAELLIGGFRNIGEIQLAIRNILDALCASPDAH